MIEGLRQFPLEVTCLDIDPVFGKKRTVYFNLYNEQLSFNGCEFQNGSDNCKACAKTSFEALKKKLRELSDQDNL